MQELQEIRMSITLTAGNRNKPATDYHPPPSRDPPAWKHHNDSVHNMHHNDTTTTTVCVEVDGVLRYATPLVRKKDMLSFRAQKEAVMPSLRSTERRLAKDLEQAMAYSAEIQKLIQAGKPCG
ncbi:hypothetical protein AAFF_G00394230 [Aldrovandia affinis]|uniref:Uncharacterized protein n=1 Tax=Aldrovandia affinis TaxID=143900 RepID=A0AAD7SDT3_9TELE|nr:hypothetical protein AAFF_G00394230 [Aldrovandia affinis]